MNSSNIPAEPSERNMFIISPKKKKKKISFLSDSSTTLLPKCAFGGTRSANVSPSANKYYQVYFH